MARLLTFGLVGLAIGALAAGSSAQAESASYKVSIGGITAGILAYNAAQSGKSYEVRGSARPSGLLGAFLDGSADTVAQGSVSGNSYRPRIAREVTKDDGEKVERTLRYSNGVPKLTRTPPRKKPQKYAAPAAQQKGTVDTTTAAYAILRDRPADLACKLDIVIYDGAKRHGIKLNKPKKTDQGMVCNGTYTRLQGFSPKEMAERQVWPVTVEYSRKGDGGYRVERVSFPTSFGKARVTRR